MASVPPNASVSESDVFPVLSTLPLTNPQHHGVTNLLLKYQPWLQHRQKKKHQKVWCPRHGHYYDEETESQQLSCSDEPPTVLTGATDFAAGSLAGVASTVVGHPFDTIKLRLQMPASSSASPHFTGALDCSKQTFQKEGIRGLYRGLFSPMATVPLVNAVVFASYGQAKAYMHAQHETKSSLNAKEAMICGAWAGLINSVVVTPVELIKCRLQAQGEAIVSNSTSTKYTGTLDCIKRIIQQDGVRGLWRGQSATIIREVPSYIGQFGTYEVLQQLFENDTEVQSTWKTLVSGGIAGCVCWTVSYPQDIIKSRIQLQLVKYKPHFIIPDGGFINCAKSIVKTEGPLALWNGYLPCILRAFPANAAAFYTYELVKRFVQSEF